jgi:[acyl-carrier-protein] S-malonyltransferase
MKVALMFPGQASQETGMGRTLFDSYPESREVFERADKALGFSISKLCFEGPDEELKRTAITQPAILTVSVAAYRALAPRLESAGANIAVAAGHSLGEYSALAAAGALDFEDAVRLVHERGRLMQEAVPEGRGAMSAILGLESAEIEKICGDTELASGEVVSLANYNCPGQWVISGSAKGVELAEKALKDAGAKRAIRLPVSAPFHCSLMLPAADGMSPLLGATAFRPTEFFVLANVNAEPYPPDASKYAGLLVRQIVSPVRWIAIAARFWRDFGASAALEVGPGKVLSGLVKRIDADLHCLSVDAPETLDATIAWISDRIAEAGGAAPES